MVWTHTCLCLILLRINDNNEVGEFTLLTSYEKSFVKFIDCVKSYELREGNTVIEVKVAKNGRTWKFGFCRDMSVALGFMSLHLQIVVLVAKNVKSPFSIIAILPYLFFRKLVFS
jgi:hypothetical protein